MSKKIKTGLLGGTFNPVHNGHISIAESFIESGAINELWVYPTPVSPFKSGEERNNLLPYHHRLSLLKKAFRQLNHPRISVKSVEDQFSAPFYTVKTLRYLTAKYSERFFYLCIGEDSLAKFHHWHKYKEILEMVTLLVAKRPGSSHIESAAQEVSNHAIVIEHHPVDIASSEIREQLARNEFEKVKSALPKDVYKEIISRNLFG